MINKLIASMLPYFPKKFVWLFSQRYIAGETLDDAIRVSHNLKVVGSWVTVDLLGEFVTKKEQSVENMNAYVKIIEMFRREPINVTFSLKPTSFGLLLDFEMCYNYVRAVVAKASETGHLLRIDMEDSKCVDLEIELYRRLHSEFPLNVGLVLQAYLKRTTADIKNLISWHTNERPVNIRLCKGIYREPESIAYKNHDLINSKFLENLNQLLSHKIYVGIATHDKFLIDGARVLINTHGLISKDYEFQMLYGVTPELRNDLILQGHNMSVYVPFGVDWFGYSTRRLKENPMVAGHIVKALFYRG
jgi:proline dehydrogenase